MTIDVQISRTLDELAAKVSSSYAIPAIDTSTIKVGQTEIILQASSQLILALQKYPTSSRWRPHNEEMIKTITQFRSFVVDINPMKERTNYGTVLRAAIDNLVKIKYNIVFTLYGVVFLNNDDETVTNITGENVEETFLNLIVIKINLLHRYEKLFADGDSRIHDTCKQIDFILNLLKTINSDASKDLIENDKHDETACGLFSLAQNILKTCANLSKANELLVAENNELKLKLATAEQSLQQMKNEPDEATSDLAAQIALTENLEKEFQAKIASVTNILSNIK